MLVLRVSFGSGPTRGPSLNPATITNGQDEDGDETTRQKISKLEDASLL
jgi:hypothetical protein